MATASCPRVRSASNEIKRIVIIGGGGSLNYPGEDDPILDPSVFDRVVRCTSTRLRGAGVFDALSPSPSLGSATGYRLGRREMRKTEPKISTRTVGKPHARRTAPRGRVPEMKNKCVTGHLHASVITAQDRGKSHRTPTLLCGALHHLYTRYYVILCVCVCVFTRMPCL